ncbi:MBL fold metallo-hydrolase [Aestuariispira insulae]|uniref:Metallo-beta-lactamase family protein n=1 Tax=Aestuariispira insulae TaxID=1461337 RepID=A0A3D9HJF7_9PROT|nr:MBL fold metallo-hydrolase [Aestuariispira insulae]RED49637.1 metallo-beta-lactamase family protein [Aestuariispira insulae]
MNARQDNNIKIAFHGAAGTVTGSCYRITHPSGSFLVDCGSFQGHKTIRELNYGKFAFDPSSVDFLLLTHAHIDHSGLIPKLCLAGFDGPVIATEPTRDLLSFMLPDSGYIQETEVRMLNRRNARRGRAAVEPIYTKEQAEASLSQIRVEDYDRWFEPGPGVRARFWNAGHILGSASIEVEIEKGDEPPLRILFSGDIGPDEKTFHEDPEAPRNLDYILVEGTYGNRDRCDLTLAARRDNLCSELKEGLARGGNVIIPAFAVERTQELLFDIGMLIWEGKLPSVPVFLDSPLAIKATACFEKHRDILPEAEGQTTLFDWPGFKMTETLEESKSLARITGGAIIMAASGMCDAGRIRHHLKNNLWRDGATVLMVGYQAQGSLGDLLRQGRKKVRIQGEEIEVRARIRVLDDYSAHADQGELLDWVQARLPVKGGVFVTHGEATALMTLRENLIAAGHSSGKVHIPALDDVYDLTPEGIGMVETSAERLEQPELSALDWHNDYAAFLIELPDRLRALSDDEARRGLLRRLDAVLHDAKAEQKWSGK